MDWRSVLWKIWMVIFTPTFFLIKILYWPVSALCNIILALLSPVFYTIQYCLRPFVYVYSILPRLQVRDRPGVSLFGIFAEALCYSRSTFS